MKKRIERAPHRALLRAVGCSSDDWGKPFIGIINSFTETVPGHIHLQAITRAVKDGIRSRGGVPFEVNTIAVCDGIAMNHQGMKYSLPRYAAANFWGFFPDTVVGPYTDAGEG